MPAYCAPPPGNMKTTPGSVPTTLCVKTRRGSFASSSAAASAWLAATSTRRLSKARRPSFSVKATSASGCSGCARRCAASALALASSAARERPESVRIWNGQSEASEGSARRRLLQHRVRVGAADAERIDPGAARPLVRGPVGQLRIHPERAGREVDGRVGRLEIPGSAGSPCGGAPARLDQARHAGRGVAMADIGLDRADAAEARYPVVSRKAAVSAATSIGSPR